MAKILVIDDEAPLRAFLGAVLRRAGHEVTLTADGDEGLRAVGAGSFDLVYSAGVLHHTPDPHRSFARVAALARPGGLVVVGVYNRLARMPSRLRRLAARLSRFTIVPFDPVLRDRRNDAARCTAWLRDQYQHPLEHTHSIGEVRRWFAENGIDYVSTYPSTLIGEEPEDLFAPAEDEWAPESVMAQLAWMRTLGGEGGLFVMVGRRPE